MSQYPNAIPQIGTDPVDGDAKAPPATFIRRNSDHANHHNALAAELIAIATELGVNPSGSVDTVAARIAAVEGQAPGGTTDWANIANKPATFPPDVHNHDSRYYTEAEVDTALSGKVATNDSRLTDDRTPLDGSVTAAKVASALKPSGSAAAGTEALRALGTGSTQAAAGDDSRFPTAGQKNALAGTSGTPGTTNQYVTTQDSRLSDARTPTDGTVTDAKITAGGLSPSKVTGTAVITSDSRLSDARAPTAHTHAQSEITNLVSALAAKVDTSDARLTDARMPSVFPWIPLLHAHVNLQAAVAGIYIGHLDVTANLLSTAASPAQLAAVMEYFDPADYAVSGKTMKMRVVASFGQNGVANAGTSVLTAGLYPVTPAGATTTFLPTYGTVITGSTAARTGGSAGSEARVVSSTFTAPAADTYALCVAVTVATTGGATKIGLRLEYSYA